jgi:hypothetical protein
VNVVVYIGKTVQTEALTDIYTPISLYEVSDFPIVHICLFPLPSTERAIAPLTDTTTSIRVPEGRFKSP